MSRDFWEEWPKCDNDDKNEGDKEYLLPDDLVMRWPMSLQISVPELFFSPKIFNQVCKPLPNIIVDSLLSVPGNIRREILGNVVLTGGSTMYEGLEERLSLEISKLAP